GGTDPVAGSAGGTRAATAGNRLTHDTRATRRIAGRLRRPVGEASVRHVAVAAARLGCVARGDFFFAASHKLREQLILTRFVHGSLFLRRSVSWHSVARPLFLWLVGVVRPVRCSSDQLLGLAAEELPYETLDPVGWGIGLCCFHR